MAEVLQIYVDEWTNELQYGTEQSQYIAMQALRSHGHEVDGEGYGQEFVWKWKPPGKEFFCVINPTIKPPAYDEHGEMKPLAPEVFAYVGEDELGSGEDGLKQGRTPAGLIPLVSVRRSKLEQDYILEQLDQQARTWGKQIRLVRYVAAEVIRTIEP